MPAILIFSLDEKFSTYLSSLLTENAYEVFIFSDPVKAVDAIRSKPYDAVLLDFPPDALINKELLVSIRCFHDFIPIIVATNEGRIDVAEDAVKNGATNYLTKPVDPQALLLSLLIALEYSELHAENLFYKRSFEMPDDPNFVLTPSESMVAIYKLIEKTSGTDSEVLISGEAGSGKNTIARMIHAGSQRGTHKFSALDCASLPLTMQETELFGYIRENTGEKMAGIFEKTNGGTVFLNNIDSLPMNTQIKILYMMQNKKFQPIGSSRMIEVDVRIIAGTSNNLHKRAIHGEFCKNLYSKLNVISICLPPLRERCEDIPALVEHFLKISALENGKFVGISSKALAILCSYDWPDNVRQLKKLIERLVLANETGQISCEELPMELQDKKQADIDWGRITDEKLDGILPLKKYLQTQERLYIQKVLERYGGDKNLAAKKLGISLASFYRKWDDSML
jgi:DNA-binding NtrC family response regulator